MAVGWLSGETYVTAGSGPYTVNNSFSLGSSGSPVFLIATTPGNTSQFQFGCRFLAILNRTERSFYRLHRPA